jgi:hypothetical protein
MKHYLGRNMPAWEVMERAKQRFQGVKVERLEEVLKTVMQWGHRHVPTISCSFGSARRKPMWPDDYLSEEGEFRALIGMRDVDGKYMEATLVLPYRDGMSLEEAFDEARSEAFVKQETSGRVRNLLEEHLEQLTIQIVPRMGPLPPEGTFPQAEA